MKFRVLPQPFGLLKLMLNLVGCFFFVQVIFKGENSDDMIYEICVSHRHVSGHL